MLRNSAAEITATLGKGDRITLDDIKTLEVLMAVDEVNDVSSMKRAVYGTLHQIVSAPSYTGNLSLEDLQLND